MERARARRRPYHLLTWLALLLLAALHAHSQDARLSSTEPDSATNLELSRPVRAWEFLDAVGMRAGLFGSEGGSFEAWVYPLKLFRNFHLTFRIGERTLPAESLARTVEVRPESCTVVFSDDAFTVRETWFVPVNESGAVITIEVNSYKPLQVEASFERDFQLMWPAGLGGTSGSWNDALHAFVFSEAQHKYFGIVGSPNATVTGEEYSANYSASEVSSISLGEPVKGNATRTIVIAGSVHSHEEAEATYQHLLASHGALRSEAAAYYKKYLDQTVSLTLPDPHLQQAYDWSRISTVQGLVDNPFLGKGLVAGYRASGNGARPGFAWFFGRDSTWTSLALDSAGDFTTARAALDFLSRYQRADGKVPHEISQSASLVPWFKEFPYPWASADATPLFIIAMNDYVTTSGDVAFVHDKWDNVWRAYQFLSSTYGPEGFAQNHGVGHGWIEGGPLLPVRTELYQSGLGVAALKSLSNLARIDGKTELARDLDQQYARRRDQLNQTFWSEDKDIFAFALDEQGKRVDIPSVLATVPMWFGLMDGDKADRMITTLAGPDHATDWGMRIISSDNPVYDPSGYHFGSVWPLFTGWASVGEYAYHRANASYANLSANSLLALEGAPGRVTEVLSGSYFESLSTSSPHQTWSSAMVMNSMLRGMLGLRVDATSRKLSISPHLPADWEQMAVKNLRVGAAALEMTYNRAADSITLTVRNGGADGVEVAFSPAMSPRAEVLGAEMDGRRVDFHIENHAADQHATVRFSAHTGLTRVRIRLRDDFGISVPALLPPLGTASRNLKLTSEEWSANRDTLVLGMAGLAGREYELSISRGTAISSVEGAQLVQGADGKRRLRVRFAEGQSGTYERRTVRLHFPPMRQRKVPSRKSESFEQRPAIADSQVMTSVP